MRLLLAVLSFFLMAAGTPSQADDFSDAAVDKAVQDAPVATAAKADPAGEPPAIEDIYADLETFANTLTIIDGHYVETKKPRDLIYGSLKGMLSSLDPHSQFLDQDAFKDMRVETEGKFGGIGVEITFRDGILTVISPVDGTPAAEAGIAPGDKIVRIDEKSTRNMELSDAVKILRGKAGTPVKLSVMREGEGRLIDFSIKRAIINVKSVKEARVLSGDVGYIRISEFQERTGRDLAKALKDVEKLKIQGLILDLRNNPGGLFNSAVEVAELFVPRGQLIVYTKGRAADQEMRLVSSGVSHPRPYPIVVLVNQGSASAAEIVAGALKDQKLALLLGIKTFGKGSVQTVIPMRDGSAIRLTTAKYFTPSGQVIHGVGITPNIEVPYEKIGPKSTDQKTQEKTSAIFDRVEKENGAETKGKDDGSQDPPKDKMPMDSQIVRAVDLIKALNVYGADGWTADAQKGP